MHAEACSRPVFPEQSPEVLKRPANKAMARFSEVGLCPVKSWARLLNNNAASRRSAGLQDFPAGGGHEGATAYLWLRSPSTGLEHAARLPTSRKSANFRSSHNPHHWRRPCSHAPLGRSLSVVVESKRHLFREATADIWGKRARRASGTDLEDGAAPSPINKNGRKAAEASRYRYGMLKRKRRRWKATALGNWSNQKARSIGFARLQASVHGSLSQTHDSNLSRLRKPGS
jgi:hypothetical protein